MYEQEVVDQEAKIAKMKKEGKDEYDIKKQVCVCDLASQTLSGVERSLAVIIHNS